MMKAITCCVYRTGLVLALLAIVPWFTVSGQTNGSLPRARLVYADDVTEVEVLDFTGTALDSVDFGTELLIGFAVRTGRSSAELRLEPNGSIIHLAHDTFLKFEEMQGLQNTSMHSAALIVGELRMVAARRSGENYRITTDTVALGVRGTDFLVRSDPASGTSVAVSDGQVEVFDPQNRGRETVAQGTAVSTDAEGGAIRRVDRGQVIVSPDLNSFSAIDPQDVPHESSDKYVNSFDYFQSIDAEAYRTFFESEDYFADYQEYMQRFYDYYQSEMEEFDAILEREAQELQRRTDREQDAIDAQDEGFAEWLENQNNWKD